VGKIVVDVDDVEVVAREMAEQTTNDTTEEPLTPPPLALLPKPGTPAKEKKLAMEKRNVAVQAKKTGVGKAKAVKVVLADKKIM